MSACFSFGQLCSLISIRFVIISGKAVVEKTESKSSMDCSGPPDGSPEVSDASKSDSQNPIPSTGQAKVGDVLGDPKKKKRERAV